MILPLAVDMDGTLLETDVLWAACRKAPWLLLAAPVALAFGGRPLFKRIAARWAKLDVAALPYREGFVAWLNEQRAQGRPLHLVTAADRETAERVAAHLGMFDTVIASEGRTNLKAHAKAAALRKRFPAGFAYAGDARPDIHVWKHAQAAVLVNVGAALGKRVRAMNIRIECEF